MPHFRRTCALCAVCAALLFADRLSSHGQEEKSSSAAKARTIEVADCTIRFPKTAGLASDRPGVVAFVQPDEGDHVKKGDRVAGLRDEVAKTNVDITKAIASVDIEVRYAKAAHAVDKKDLERALKANERQPNAVPEMEVSKLQLAMERSGLQIEKAQHDQTVNKLKWEQAEAEWKTYQVEAPFDAVVTRVLKQQGDAVRQGDVILEVVNTERVRIEGAVEIKDAFAIKPGARVVVKLDIPNVALDVEEKTFEGRVGFVDITGGLPGVDKVRVWAEVQNQDDILRSNLLATMTIYPDDVVEPKKAAAQRENSGAAVRTASP